MTFDATSREHTTVRRVRTNTPLQALTTLNDEAYFEAARRTGGESVEGGDRRATAPERIYAFRLVATRHAKARKLNAFWRRTASARTFQERSEPMRLKTIKGHEVADVDAAQQAAWTLVQMRCSTSTKRSRRNS
jgi:hypothetical protein